MSNELLQRDLDFLTGPRAAVIKVDGLGGQPELGAVRLGHERGNVLAGLAARVLATAGAGANWIAGARVVVTLVERLARSAGRAEVWSKERGILYV